VTRRISGSTAEPQPSPPPGWPDDIAENAALGEFAAPLGQCDRTLFAAIAIRADEPPRVLPTLDGVFLKSRFRQALGVD
jgi:hypothetical protein